MNWFPFYLKALHAYRSQDNFTFNSQKKKILINKTTWTNYLLCNSKIQSQKLRQIETHAPSFHPMSIQYNLTKVNNFKSKLQEHTCRNWLSANIIDIKRSMMLVHLKVTTWYARSQGGPNLAKTYSEASIGKQPFLNLRCKASANEVVLNKY